jgi:hypothetical protein
MDARGSGLSASPKYGYFVVGLFNRHRTHWGVEGKLPDPEAALRPLKLDSYRWQQHCRGLYQTPIAA